MLASWADVHSRVAKAASAVDGIDGAVTVRQTGKRSSIQEEQSAYRRACSGGHGGVVVEWPRASEGGGRW